MERIIKKINIGSILIVVGLMAVVCATVLYFYNVRTEYEAAKASLNIAEALISHLIITEKTDSAVTGFTGENTAEISSEQDETGTSTLIMDGQYYIGVLSIPALELDLPVNKQWSYPLLKLTPCRYSGSVVENDLVILAHNYNTHFGNISMLRTNNPVYFTDADGIVHSYAVKEIETVTPNSVTKIVYSNYDLVLVTCNYNGEARVVVRCARK